MIVQDRPVMQKQAEEVCVVFILFGQFCTSYLSIPTQFWASADPDAIPSGRVEWQVYDFFTPQPVKGAAVYFVHAIMYALPNLHHTLPFPSDP